MIKKEDESVKTKTMLESITNAITIDILLLTKDRKIVWANKKLLNQTGKILQGITGKYCYQIIYKIDKPCQSIDRDCPIKECLKTKKPASKTHIHTLKDNRAFYCDVTVYPIKNEKEEITHLVHITKDVTQQKNYEKALEESENKYRLLIQNSVVGIGLSKDNKVLFVNKAMLDIFGYENAEEFYNLPLLDHITPEYRQKNKERLQRLENNENIEPTFEYAIIKKNGEIRDVEASTSQIIINGEKYRQTIIKDITEKKKYQESLETSKKLIEKEVKRKTRKIKELNKELEEYAKRLDIKIKKIEERKIPLTQKEKLAFYGLVKYPGMTSKELGEKIGLHTATVNTIKNRLKEEKYFKTLYMPRLDLLGYELLTIECYQLKICSDKSKTNKIKSLAKKLSDIDGNVYVISTDNAILIINFSKDMSDFRENQDLFEKEVRKNNLEFEFNKKIQIPMDKGVFYDYFDYAKLLKKRFEIKINDISELEPEYTRYELKLNEKILVYALSKHPEYTVDQLSKITKISVPTICKLKNKLISQRIIKIVNIPDLTKIGMELILFLYRSFLPEPVERGCETNNSFFTVNTSTDHTIIAAFKDFTDEESSISFCKCYKGKKISDNPIKILIPLENLIISKLDFTPLLKKIFGF